MNKRNFFRLNQQKLKETKGTEDIAGRRLPSEIYHFLPRAPFRTRPSKADLRDQADRALAEWHGRAHKGGSLTVSSSC